MERIDLHTHSNASDGTMTPAELIQHAYESGLRAVALTDHDTTDGLNEAYAEAKRLGIELVKGIELSAVYLHSTGKTEIHILGYDIDETHPEFAETVAGFRRERENRNVQMIVLLQKQGFDVTEEAMKAMFSKDAVITRAHFARYLYEHHYVSSMREAFERYLSPGKPCYLEKKHISPEQAIEIICKAGGRPVLAHPFLYSLDYGELVTMLEGLVSLGLCGIETYYSGHTTQDVMLAKRLAKRFGLKRTGGSDFHGSNKKDIAIGRGYGTLEIPYEVLVELRERE